MGMTAEAITKQEKAANKAHREAYPYLYENKDEKDVKEHPENVENTTPEEKGTAPDEDEVITPDPDDKKGEPEDASKEEGVEEKRVIPSKEDGFEHKYKVLRGKYDAEIPLLKQEINTLTEQIQALSAGKSEEDARWEPETKTVDEALNSLQEEYGEEFTDAISRFVRNEIQAELKPVKGDIDNLHNKTSQIKDPQEVFYNDLDEKAPQWSVLNSDPAFLNWLTTNSEPVSGMTYHDILNAAYEKQDVARVAHIFNSFKKPSTKKKKGADEYISPSTTRKGSESVPGDKKIYTRAEIEAFYKKVSEGLYEGQEDKVAQYEKAIFLAQNEGRIV